MKALYWVHAFCRAAARARISRSGAAADADAAAAAAANADGGLSNHRFFDEWLIQRFIIM